MAKKLRIGIVGAGSIATTCHLPSYAELSDLVEIVAVADIVPERAKAAAERFGIPHYFASVEELLANVEVDCVDICTMMKPPLPVVHQPEQEIGQFAAKYLIERLSGFDGPSRVTRLKCSIAPKETV